MCNLQQRMRVKCVLYLGPQAPPTTQQGAGAQPRDEKLAGCKSCNTKSESHAVESGPGARTVQECQALCEHACTSRHTSASNTQVQSTAVIVTEARGISAVSNLQQR